MSAAFLAQFVAIGIYSYVLGSFMAPMSAELEWSRGDFTLSRSIGQIVMAMAGIFIGSLIDRIGPRPIMATGTVVLSCSLVLHSQIESLWAWWLLNGLVLTIGCAMVGNLVVNVTLSKWFVLNRGKAIAIAAMGVSLGGIIITPLATYLVDELGWRAAWIWLGVLSFLLMVPVTWAMRSRPEDYGLYPDGLSADAYQSDQGERARNEAESAYTPERSTSHRQFLCLSHRLRFLHYQYRGVATPHHSLSHRQRDWQTRGRVRHGYCLHPSDVIETFLGGTH